MRAYRNYATRCSVRPAGLHLSSLLSCDPASNSRLFPHGYGFRIPSAHMHPPYPSKVLPPLPMLQQPFITKSCTDQPLRSRGAQPSIGLRISCLFTISFSQRPFLRLSTMHVTTAQSRRYHLRDALFTMHLKKHHFLHPISAIQQASWKVSELLAKDVIHPLDCNIYSHTNTS